MLAVVGHVVIGSPYTISRAFLSFVQKHTTLWRVTHLHHIRSPCMPVKEWIRAHWISSTWKSGCVPLPETHSMRREPLIWTQLTSVFVKSDRPALCGWQSVVRGWGGFKLAQASPPQFRCIGLPVLLLHLSFHLLLLHSGGVRLRETCCPQNWFSCFNGKEECVLFTYI